jgi:3-oxoacyl-[acyl-carrier protein] reductase
MKALENKVALVTGAASKKGLGRAIALRLAGEGAHVAVLDKFAVPQSVWAEDEGWGGLAAVVKEIEAEGRQGLALEADVSDGRAVDAAVAQTIRKLGKIDILVHGGGVRGPMKIPVMDLSEEQWRGVIDVNLTGSFLISRAVARTMIPDGQGKKIVLVGSLGGTKGYPGSSAYCCSKYGVVGLGKTLAQELAQYKINVNIIHPGGFDTNLRDDQIRKIAETKGVSLAEAIEEEKRTGPPENFIPLGRLGRPEEIADLIFFLVSNQSAYITGAEIIIGGGLT